MMRRMSINSLPCVLGCSPRYFILAIGSQCHAHSTRVNLSSSCRRSSTELGKATRNQQRISALTLHTGCILNQRWKLGHGENRMCGTSYVRTLGTTTRVSSDRGTNDDVINHQDLWGVRGRLDGRKSPPSDNITDDVALATDDEHIGNRYYGLSGDLLAQTNSVAKSKVGNGKSRTSAKWKSISRKKTDLRPVQEKDILYGISPCLLALEGSRRTVSKVYLTPSFKASSRPEALKILQKIEDLSLGDFVDEVHREDLDRMTRGRPHQGVSLLTSRLHFEPLPDGCTDDDKCLPGPSVYLGLEQILDPMNMGAILRSAYYLGVDRIIASRRNCCSLTPVVSKASSGVMEVMPVYATNNMMSFIQTQRGQGWEIVGSTCVSSSQESPSLSPPVSAVDDFQLSKPTVLIVGSEGRGLSDSLQKECTHLLTVPAGRVLHDGIDSLNVSVAVGILLQSILLQRGLQQSEKNL